MMLLENNRIRLRALEPEDLDFLYKWENNTEWWGVGSTLTPYSRYHLKEYIAESHRDIYELKQLRLVVELKENGLPVGLVDLYDFDPRHKRAGVGILLDTHFQKNGLATDALQLIKEYAFTHLNLHQLFAFIPVKNEASQKLFTRCGFDTTGKLTDWLCINDTFEDVLVLQLLNH